MGGTTQTAAQRVAGVRQQQQQRAVPQAGMVLLVEARAPEDATTALPRPTAAQEGASAPVQAEAGGGRAAGTAGTVIGAAVAAQAAANAGGMGTAEMLASSGRLALTAASAGGGTAQVLLLAMQMRGEAGSRQTGTPPHAGPGVLLQMPTLLLLLMGPGLQPAVLCGTLRPSRAGLTGAWRTLML